MHVSQAQKKTKTPQTKDLSRLIVKEKILGESKKLNEGDYHYY